MDALTDGATIAGGIVAAAAILGAVWALARRTFARRWNHYRRLRRLGTNAQLSFFTSVLGQPPAFRRSLTFPVGALANDGTDEIVKQDQPFQECVYVDRDYFVDAIVDTDETVVQFGVTTRAKRFRPQFESAPKGNVPRLQVRLGRTRFADLPEEPERLFGSMGARRFWYSEIFYFGNPGHYQTFACSFNDGGAWAREARPGDGLFDVEDGEWDIDVRGPLFAEEAEAREEFLARPGVQRFRRETRINTWTVIATTFDPIHDDPPAPSLTGADQDHVRTLP